MHCPTPRSTITWLTLATLLTLPRMPLARSAPLTEQDVAIARDTCMKEFTAARYVQALPACQTTLQAAEQLLGPDEQDVGAWQLALGMVLDKLKKPAEAETHLLSSLRIYDKTLGPEHPEVATVLDSLAILYKSEGRYTEAAPLFQRSLRIKEKTLGPDDPQVAITLNGLALTYYSQGRSAEAEPLFQRCLRIYETALGPDNPLSTIMLDAVAWLHQSQGRSAEAAALLLRSLRIKEKTLGSADPQLATSLNGLASVYKSEGRYAEAEPHLLRSLQIREKALGPEHPDVAVSLHSLAGLYQAQGRYAEAEPLQLRSLRILETTQGREHLQVATALNGLAGLYAAQDRYVEAGPLLLRSLQIRESALGPEHPEVAAVLNDLGELHQAQGRYAEAESHYLRGLRIKEKALGREHRDVAITLNNLAGLYQVQGRYAEAEPHQLRSLGIFEKTFGSEHPQVATALNNLAELYQALGRYDEAKSLYLRSLRICEKALGPEHPEVATTLNNLAGWFRTQGQYAEAERHQLRSLHIVEKALGPKHANVAVSLNNLAVLYELQGRYGEAASIQLRSLSILEKARGAEHVDVATTVNNLATLYQAQGRNAEAEAHFKRSLRILEKVMGLESPKLVKALNNLATLYQVQGRDAEAESHILRGLRIQEKTLSPEHPEVAITLNNLAGLYQVQGRYAEAEPHQLHSLRIFEKAFGSEHPDVATALNNLAWLYLAREHMADALTALSRSAQIRERQIRDAAGEIRAESLLASMRSEEEMTYGLLLDQRSRSSVQRLALTMALLRKGRGGEAAAATNRLIHRNRENPIVEQSFREWQSVRRQREALIYRGLGELTPATYRERLKDLEVQGQSLEAKLATELHAIHTLQPPTFAAVLPEVAKRLPQGSALVEVVWAEPFLPHARGTEPNRAPAHYIALLLFPDQRIASLDLGAAADVDAQVRNLQTSLQSPGSDPRPSAQALYQQVLQPLLPLLGSAKELYLSLDGSLNIVPFDALYDGGDYLLGHYRFHYLTSGRDLLQQSSKRAPGPPLLLANPDFGKADPLPKTGDQPSFYQKLALSALPGTQREADVLGPLLGVRALTGGAATEAALRQSGTPRILHIATHGLFLQDVELSVPFALDPSRRSFSFLQLRSKLVGASYVERLPGEVDGMNRSALALAGVLQGGREKDSEQDGLLTAQEARSLDLEGTQLVVLSACDTGQGGLSIGQGIYGLRRAFLVAGAETLVTSLWRVADDATSELMEMYYQRLLDKQKPGDRLGAMVEAMQKLRGQPGRSHPYYWAPFLVIGQDGPLRL